MKYSLVLFIIVVAALAALASQYVTLEELQQHEAELSRHVHTHRAQSVVLFGLLYIAVTALSIPGAALFTVASGALFGVPLGTLIVSVSSTLGSTLSFLLARYVMRDRVRAWGGKTVASINESIERDGVLYLIALRLAPGLPYFLVNWAMGLTSMRTWTFIWATQLGTLPGTAAYANAGTALSSLNSYSEILSTEVLVSFAILALLPLVGKRLLNYTRGRAEEQAAGAAKPTR
jgi:uncharacterized membrane protein YdjX (TVP38/TMEM64 family)